MSKNILQTASAELPTDRIKPFVASKVFNNLFASGMELVEETALYLDEDGKHQARSLPRDAALAYAGLSMRLTTRLMQIASWLLVLRAVRDGEMTAIEASDDKYRLGTPEGGALGRGDHAALPERMMALVEDTDTLYTRISRLDTELFREEEVRTFGDGAAGQLAALRDAFGN